MKTQLGHSLSTIHKKCFSLNSYSISILFGLFERARACALKFLPDLRNFKYWLTYYLIRTQLGHNPIKILFGFSKRARACA